MLMQTKISKLLKKNIEILFLTIVLLITILTTIYYNQKKEILIKNYKETVTNIYFQNVLNLILNNLTPKYVYIEHKISTGDTFDQVLSTYNVPETEINKLKKKLSEKINLNLLNENEILRFTYDQSNNNSVTKLIFPVSKTKKIYIKKDLAQNEYIIDNVTINLSKKVVYKENLIFESLYKSASSSKIPANIIVEFAGVYGFQVDFQRDIRKRDSFQMIYEIFENDDGIMIETGNILFANLKLSGTENKLYYFDKKGSEGHFDESGKSVKKALMKTPINGARLSSPFGMRKHPIDGFNKMHKGTDFAAPMGTPVMASGDGIIKKASWCGGGGNCIKIKHNSVYETIYAHLSKFAKISKVGQRVRQGQIIGYVGSTGKSTGPHLHYEVVKNGKKINSQTLKLPSGKILKSNERKLFETKKIKLDVLKSELIMGLN